jgi:hypothetical protein
MYSGGEDSGQMPEFPVHNSKALFISLVFSPSKDVGICGDLVFT